jgi:hypothetical protein
MVRGQARERTLPKVVIAVGKAAREQSDNVFDVGFGNLTAPDARMMRCHLCDQRG